MVRDRLLHYRTGLTTVQCKDLIKNHKPNLSTSEFNCIRELSENHSIVIKPADKGGAVVIMDSLLYEAEGL